MPDPPRWNRDPRGYNYSSVQRIQEEAANEFYALAQSLTPQIGDALARGTAQTAKSLLQLLQAFQVEFRSMRSRLGTMYEELARGAQEATVEAYQSYAGAGRRGSGPYRTPGQGDRYGRYAGGMLLQALQSADFIRATPDGIGFANMSILDDRAKQWHRLNFGAGESAGESARTYDVRASDLVIASIGFEDESPSAPFMLPRGYWLTGEGGGGDEFYPMGELSSAGATVARRAGQGQGTTMRAQARVPTRGIRAWNFLDAGVRYIAENLGPALDSLGKQLYDQAETRGRGAFARIEERIEPRPLNVEVLER